VVALPIICVDDAGGRDELSVELEILLIAVAATSAADGDVVISMEVAYVSDVDDNDEYSLDIDAPLAALIVLSLAVLEIPFVIAERNSLVDSSDSIDEVRSL
jgi:hypothetical protein